MSDGTTLNPGSGGDVIATDDVGGVKYQVVKLDLGGDGVSSPVVTALPVSAESLPLPTGAATQATLASLQTLLTTLSGSIALHDSVFVPGSPGQIILGKRMDSDATTVADGDLNMFNMDEEGRLKVASKPASYVATVGNVTSATSTVPINTERFSNLMVHCTGTFAGANCTFEGSLNSTNGTDGNWFGVQAIRSNANTIETATGVLAAAPAYAWELSVNALKYFRIRATAWTSGTQVWTMIPGTYATEPIPGAQASATQPVSGTVTTTLGSPTNASIVNSAASTNGTVIKASAGNVYGIIASNSGAASAYVKLHNSTTVTAGTTPVALWIKIAAGETVRFDWGPLGARFGTGVCMSITGAVADNDTTAVTASQVKVVTSFI